MACLCKCLSKLCFWRSEAPYDNTKKTPSLRMIDSSTEAKMHEDTVVIYQILEAIKLAAREDSRPSNEDDDDDDDNVQIYNIKTPCRRKGGVIIMKDYDSTIFKKIRANEGVTEDDYVRSWTFDPLSVPRPQTGAGRSGCMFLRSADKRFIYKTIHHHEVETLRSILPQYCEHLQKNPRSRLMRFFALHRFQIKNDYFYLIVANNIFYSRNELVLQKQYDLKGRVPKQSSLIKLEGQASIGSILKDNQLGDRKFYPDSASELCGVLRCDAEFLAALDCIDYSLLIGVHSKTVSNPKLEEKEFKEERCAFINSEQYSNDVETRQGPYSTLSDIFGVGIPSTHKEENEIYFVGIIDFLSRYYIKKKTANFFKTIRWGRETLSTVPPEFYCQRFCNYLETIITTPENRIENAIDHVGNGISRNKMTTFRRALGSRIGSKVSPQYNKQKDNDDSNDDQFNDDQYNDDQYNDEIKQDKNIHDIRMDPVHIMVSPVVRGTFPDDDTTDQSQNPLCEPIEIGIKDSPRSGRKFNRNPTAVLR